MFGAAPSAGVAAFEVIGGKKSGTGATALGASDLVFGVSNYYDDYSLTVNGAGFVGIGNLTPSVELDVNGSIEYEGTITDVSDARLKENITDFESGLDIVNSIGVKNFNMIGKDKRETGFIAQNVKEFWPEGVSIIDPENGYMGVSYVSFIPILTRAVQELSQKLDNVKDDLTLWFADAGNGIADFFANRVHTAELCVGTEGDETCISKSQLDEILQNPNANSGGGDEPVVTEPEPDPSGEEEVVEDPDSSESEETTPPPAPLLDQGGDGGGNSEPAPDPESLTE